MISLWPTPPCSLLRGRCGCGDGQTASALADWDDRRATHPLCIWDPRWQSNAGTIKCRLNCCPPPPPPPPLPLPLPLLHLMDEFPTAPLLRGLTTAPWHFHFYDGKPYMLINKSWNEQINEQKWNRKMNKHRKTDKETDRQTDRQTRRERERVREKETDPKQVFK